MSIEMILILGFTFCTLVGSILLVISSISNQRQSRTLYDVLKEIHLAVPRTEAAVKYEISSNREEQGKTSKALRDEVGGSVKGLTDSVLMAFNALANTQKERLAGFGLQLSEMSRNFAAQHEGLRTVLDSKLKDIQADNASKLELMRQTVDEKLQSTLEKRLSESFVQVTQRLEQVHKGLGEMQGLANGVGDLKRLMTNVKTRGTWGEIQLGNILEDILVVEQYEKNVSLKKGSAEAVEFAIKLPGQGPDASSVVFLPIDSKFPQEDYQRLLLAQDQGDIVAEKTALSGLEASVKREARTIRDKYINPPVTTDFAVMFLPTESLYAEVLRRPGLSEQLQKEFRVIVTGPTTLAALLNSLSVGFKTLAIQKKSSEVWQVLSAVRTQFSSFGDMLDNVQKKLDDASSAMEKASKKSRTIEKRLSKFDALPFEEANILIPEEV